MYFWNEVANVIGVDNLSHGMLRNIQLALSNRNFEFHQLDVCDLDAVRRTSAGVTAIAHLAAFKIPRYGKAIDTLLVNSQGSHNMLQLAVEQKAKFLLASTSDVYGKNPNLPSSEAMIRFWDPRRLPAGPTLPPSCSTST